MPQDLIDPVDGENRAVRMFLALYGCNPSTTVGQMRQHLTFSGFPHWPDWAAAEPESAHLTKGGAQHWLRHLFALELTDERIDALMPEADGLAEANKVRCEVLPGVPGYEFDEVDAWSAPLVRQTVRAALAAR